MNQKKRITATGYWLSLGMKVLIAVLVFAGGFIIFLYVQQENMLFFPQPISPRESAKIRERHRNVEDIGIRAKDGALLRGWLVKETLSNNSPLILYFGGNAEEVSHLIAASNRFGGWALALVNYRGYGLSEGRPSEKGLFEDAIATYDFFSKRADIDHNRIIAMGRSLGSGVAVYLARHRHLKGLILITPYDSIMSVAREKFPYLPVSLLLKHRFDSISLAPLIKLPILALVAKDDTTVPPQHAVNLVKQWGGPCTLRVLEGVGHNTIDLNPLYWQSIEDYLSRM